MALHELSVDLYIILCLHKLGERLCGSLWSVNKHLRDWRSADWPIASKCITNINIAVEILRVTSVGSIITFIDGDVNPYTFGMWHINKIKSSMT